VVAADIESALLRGHVPGDKSDGNIHIQQHAAFQAVDMVMTVDTPVIAACLVSERQFLNKTMRSEQVERSIHRAVANAGVAPTHTLENLTRGQVPLGLAHLFEDFRSLGCVPESISGHSDHTVELENESH
jgi:hypothetical protein